MCPQRSGDLEYESVVETEEDLVARIIVAAGTIADTSGIFERTRQSMVRRCTASYCDVQVLFDIETKGQVFCIALGPVTIYPSEQLNYCIYFTI